MMHNIKCLVFLSWIAFLAPSYVYGQEIDSDIPEETGLDVGESGDIESRMADLERRLNVLHGKLEEADHKIALLESKSSVQKQTEGRVVEKDKEKNLEQLDKENASDAEILDGEPDPQYKERAKERYVTKKPEFDEENDKVRDDQDTAEDTYLPLGTPQADYEHAVSLLRDGDDKKAQKAFQYFIKNYAKDPLALNAKYWLAETYFVQKDFKQASVHFAEAYQEYSEIIEKGKNKEKKKQAYAKAPEALAKLAFSLKSMGKKEDACVALEELSSTFKQVAPNVKRLVAKAKDGLACK